MGRDFRVSPLFLVKTMHEKIEVVSLTRQLYDMKMHDPGESFPCDPADASALETIGYVRRKTNDDADKKNKKGRYDRRDMRADA